MGKNHTVEEHGHYLEVGLRNGGDSEFTCLAHNLHRLSFILKTTANKMHISCSRTLQSLKLQYILGIFECCFCSTRDVFVQRYLVYSKLSINSKILLELFVPVAFEVDGIDQYQPGCVVHHTLDQHVLDFTCMVNSNEQSQRQGQGQRLMQCFHAKFRKIRFLLLLILLQLLAVLTRGTTRDAQSYRVLGKDQRQRTLEKEEKLL